MDNGVSPLVEMIGISKSYGGVRACRDIDFTVRAGEVHALLGENGAGKSTLMRVLSGDVTGYAGRVVVCGTPQRFAAPVDAQRAGVAMIHQELDLVPGLSVAENIFLGREPRTRLRTVNRREMNRVTRALLERCGVTLDPRRPVGELRTGEQQLVTIAKALSLDAKVLIMDEPTSALSPVEVQQMFTVISELRRAGAGIVYISHRMDEIGRIADRATVLRNGAVVAGFDAREMTAERAAEAMVGRPVQAMFRARARSRTVSESEGADAVWTEERAQARSAEHATREGGVLAIERSEPFDTVSESEGADAVWTEEQRRSRGDRAATREGGVLAIERSEPFNTEVLRVTDLALRPRRERSGRREPNGISLSVRRGEIVGIGGLLGSGRTELLETLFGAGSAGELRGEIRFAGKRVRPRRPRQALRLGMAFVPEDRRVAGLAIEHSVLANTVLSIVDRLASAGVVGRGREIGAVRRIVGELKVKLGSIHDPVGTLSGGNQQKVVFGRMLLTEPALLLLDEPTRGVDVGAKAEIYQLLGEAAERGIGVLLASSELAELVGVCDRVVVLSGGRSVRELDTRQAGEADLLAASMGEGSAAMAVEAGGKA